MKINKGIMLIRKDWTIQVNAKTWSEILLYLNDKGWNPDGFLTSFLGNREVSDFEAKQINVAGQKILDQTLKNPLSVYPVSFDMGTFAEIVYFCEEGSFRISTK
ncbi:MAG: hypothetical protein KBA11_05035 [Sedimentibacter sp.]|nr:hypothetical protein [Sedimentibacter sp.]